MQPPARLDHAWFEWRARFPTKSPYDRTNHVVDPYNQPQAGGVPRQDTHNGLGWNQISKLHCPYIIVAKYPGVVYRHTLVGVTHMVLPYTKRKGANRAMPWPPHFFRWASMMASTGQRLNCKRARSCLHTWMTCMSSPAQGGPGRALTS